MEISFLLAATSCARRTADIPGRDRFFRHPHQPHFALRLSTKVVRLVYCCRHGPFGVGARLPDRECTSAATAPECTLREDGGSGDLGYPWATLSSRHRALVVCCFNTHDGTRHS